MAREPRPGERLLRDLTQQLATRPGIAVAHMFGSDCLQVDEKLFAFVSRDDELAVKLPSADARAALADGSATHVTMGTRTMKEWVTYPLPADGDRDGTWATAIDAAVDHVASLPPKVPRARGPRR